MRKRTWFGATALFFAIWVALSGRLEIKFLLYGGVAAILAGWIFAKINDEMKISIIAFVKYFFWLIKEVVKSSIDVTKIVLSREMKINPQIIEFDWDYRNDYAATLLTNSIILTPSTVTLDVRDGKHFIVHALTDSAAKGLLEGTMQRKVEEVFK